MKFVTKILLFTLLIGLASPKAEAIDYTYTWAATPSGNAAATFGAFTRQVFEEKLRSGYKWRPASDTVPKIIRFRLSIDKRCYDQGKCEKEAFIRYVGRLEMTVYRGFQKGNLDLPARQLISVNEIGNVQFKDFAEKMAADFVNCFDPNRSKCSE